MYFKPSYLPQNGAANILVRSLAEDLGVSLNKKYEIILASFLAIAKKVNGQAFDWWAGNENKNLKLWSLFPHISNKSVRKVYRLLKENDYVELGQLGAYGLTFRTKFNGFYSDEIYEVEDAPIMSLYNKDIKKSTFVA